uniref:EF-hand domain-containing protein n=1 Tax=Phaeomonas parva TaxID=124430 RepID=A0A7S1UFN2_9STRA|mmetsp:Transcript_44268/g.139020  ORF Transcript_44268/g.139020 Transcript_44268/m.139020 type:complete len:293 (+) Transcript_44268:140-1018(+)
MGLDAPTIRKWATVYRKWSGVLIFGPLPWAFFAIFTTLVGSVLIHTAKLKCLDLFGDAGNNADNIANFIRGAIVVSYLFLMLYAWLFLGFKWDLKIMSRKYPVLRPIPNLAVLCTLYAILAVVTVPVFAYGAWSLSDSYCLDSVPTIYSFASFITIVYFCIATVHVGVVLTMACAATARNAAITGVDSIMDARRHSTNNSMLEAAKKRFLEYDKDGSGELNKRELKKLLREVNKDLTTEEIANAVELLDESGDGMISLEEFLNFCKLSAATTPNPNPKRSCSCSHSKPKPKP